MTDEVVFKAMADGTRRRILQLVGRHELSVNELVACLSQPQSTVSRHLKVLRQAGLIHDRREGTVVHYAAHEPPSPSNGDDPTLESRMLDWTHRQELPRTLERRMERVLNRRQARSTEFFSRVGSRWDHMRIDAFGRSFHLEAITDLLPREWVAADIGTGTGFLLPTLADAFRRVIAVEPVSEMLSVARQRCASRGIKNVTFKRGDLGRLPIQDERVDLACAMLVLHHVPSPPEALAELHRIVKPGGRLLIVEQRSHQLADFHERMQDRWWGFESSDLCREVSRAGFDRPRCRSLACDAGGGEAPELFVLTARRGG